MGGLLGGVLEAGWRWAGIYPQGDGYARLGIYFFSPLKKERPPGLLSSHVPEQIKTLTSFWGHHGWLGMQPKSPRHSQAQCGTMRYIPITCFADLLMTHSYFARFPMKRTHTPPAMPPRNAHARRCPDRHFGAHVHRRIRCGASGGAGGRYSDALLPLTDASARGAASSSRQQHRSAPGLNGG